MRRELIETGRTVDAAIDSACEKLGCPREDVEWEIISLPKKGFFGLRNTPAKVRVSAPVKESAPPKAATKPAEKPQREPRSQREARPERTPRPELRAPKETKPVRTPKEVVAATEQEAARPTGDKEQLAVSYVSDILNAMGLSANISCQRQEDDLSISLEGQGLGVIIGRRGETLDAIQYLCGLVVNRLEGDYLRVTLDCGDYRVKRRSTLEALAKRIAGRVSKNGGSVTLEPMNPFERRVIHAAVSEIAGVSSTSIGEGVGRRVVISSASGRKSEATARPSGGREQRRGGRGRRGASQPRREHLDIRDNGFPLQKDEKATAPVVEPKEAKPAFSAPTKEVASTPEAPAAFEKEAVKVPEYSAPVAEKATKTTLAELDTPLYGKIDLD